MRNRRRVPRYLFGVAASLSYSTEPITLGVTLGNISFTGCAADEIGDLRVGQECQLGIEYRGAEIQVKAEVVWKDREGRAGLKFLRVAPENEKLLADLCFTLELQPVDSPPERAA